MAADTAPNVTLEIVDVRETCPGAGETVTVSVRNATSSVELARVAYGHLTNVVTRSGTAHDGTVLGQLATWPYREGCWEVTTDQGVHTHLAVDNTHHASCFVPYAKGQQLTAGTPIGKLGGDQADDPRTPCPAEPRPPRSGYWMVSLLAEVYAFGDAPYHGNGPRGPIGAVDIEPAPSGNGYWILDAQGLVTPLGEVTAIGGKPTLRQGESITSMSATPTGGGYWLFSSFGRVFPRGDAVDLGDMEGIRLNQPVLDSVATPTGRGYFMVAGDGGVFAFGDAVFRGSTGNMRLNESVRSLVPDGDGDGYWLVARDGGVFAFSAPFRGSMGNVRLNAGIIGMVRYGDGYVMAGSDGGIFNFSDKEFHGSLGGNPPPTPIVAVAAYE